MDYFLHPNGLCESTNVGKSTRIWAFAHVLPGAVIGEDCNICDHVFVENLVVIGNRVTIKCGVQVWDGLTIEDDVFVGPNVTFTNDLFPRSKKYLDSILNTRICRKASIGANATILPGIVIGKNAFVSAGSVVTRSVPPNAVVKGNPARITGYVNDEGSSILSVKATQNKNKEPNVMQTSVENVTLHFLPLIEDMRGDLSVGEFARNIPFSPKRYFLVFNVPSSRVRGEHAHRQCHQFLVCVNGSCSVVVDDGKNREEIILDNPYTGLYIPKMVWATQYKHSTDSVLLVFASDYYDSEDYIRDFDQFLLESKNNKGGDKQVAFKES